MQRVRIGDRGLRPPEAAAGAAGARPPVGLVGGGGGGRRHVVRRGAQVGERVATRVLMSCECGELVVSAGWSKLSVRKRKEFFFRAHCISR